MFCCKKCGSRKKQWQLVMIMLGIDDPWIWGVYILCILSALLCMVYGIINWNREGELEAIEIKEEETWEAKEEEMQKEELGL
ncbi:MAG: symporter small accessory protein [Methanothrix sp.]